MHAQQTALDRIADRLDLAIDFLTLGQYGLERRQTPAPAAGCEGGGHHGGCREALPPALSRGCERIRSGARTRPAPQPS